ncbi:MAG: M60 family metallopeptidase, partial [Fimbriimonadaceae bacterium]|nr:M60 family metallopeptidase [Fimbriimonadaceae bacterium]
RSLDDAEAVAKFWDAVCRTQFELAGRPAGHRKERIVADAQISAGYMHAGYPIMTWLDVVPLVSDVARLKTEGTWGHFHEVGHNVQESAWTFGGTGEVTCNIFTLYTFDMLVGSRPERNRFDDQMNLDRWKKYVADGASFEQWKSDPFLALVMYAQLQRAFGWDAYKRVFRDYRNAAPAELPRSDAEKRSQWMVRFSNVVGRNLAPFFDAWRIPIADSARDQVVHLPVWMPEGMTSPPSVR